MKQTNLAVLVSALFFGAAGAMTSATAADRPAASVAAPAAIQLAKRGADDVTPEPCDDHGTDICAISGAAVAKHGDDDVTPEPCDDHGTDICAIKA